MRFPAQQALQTAHLDEAATSLELHRLQVELRRD
jgi:hypothetical protein